MKRVRIWASALTLLAVASPALAGGGGRTETQTYSFPANFEVDVPPFAWVGQESVPAEFHAQGRERSVAISVEDATGTAAPFGVAVGNHVWRFPYCGRTTLPVRRGQTVQVYVYSVGVLVGTTPCLGLATQGKVRATFQ